jgi:energy-coupling factor transporter ATP-binding protein EcfA2
VRVQDLCKRYGATGAVADVSLDVLEGEIFGLLGPNASGKTTTVERVQGLRRPDAGWRVSGLVRHGPRERRSRRPLVGGAVGPAGVVQLRRCWWLADEPLGVGGVGGVEGLLAGRGGAWLAATRCSTTGLPAVISVRVGAVSPRFMDIERRPAPDATTATRLTRAERAEASSGSGQPWDGQSVSAAGSGPSPLVDAATL